MNNNRIIYRPAEVAEMLGISKSTLDRWSQDPRFPQRIKLSPRVVGYDATDIQAYVDSFKE